MSTKPFAPSSEKLNAMIANAMRKCDASIEQARLAKEAAAERRIVKTSEAIAAQRRLLFWFDR